MNRRAVLGFAVGGGGVVLAMLIGCRLNAWLRPDLTGASSAKLKIESRALFERCRREPWYIGWAPAIRHEQVYTEMHRRGVLRIGTESGVICAASEGAFVPREQE